jgi:hypothetical protein
MDFLSRPTQILVQWLFPFECPGEWASRFKKFALDQDALPFNLYFRQTSDWRLICL